MTAQVYVGVPAALIPGSTCKEQMEKVDRMNFDAFLVLAQDKGFVYQSSVGSALVIPPRFMVLNVAISSAAHGVRWQLFGKKGNVSETLKLMTTAVAENKELTRHALVKDICAKLVEAE